MQARRSAALPRPWWIAAGLLLVTCACGVTSGDRPSVSSESARPATSTTPPAESATSTTPPAESATSTTPPAESATKPAGAGGKQRRPGERVLATAYVTGYSVHDNSPPGSARIAYPNERHEVAAGVGSYDDPITVAVGWHRKEGTQWPVRSRFYLPYLRKYAVVEDQCGDRAQDGPCYQLDEAPDGATTWIDVWAGGEGRARAATERCLTRITGIHLVIHRPAKGYPVNRGEVAAACDRDEFWPDRRPAVPGG